MNAVPLPSVPNVRDKLSARWGKSVVEYLRSITPIAGGGVRLRRGFAGTEISATAKAGKIRHETVETEKLEPFTLRFHKTKDDSEGQFEIYLPYGSMTVEQNCVPLNKPARSKSSHDTDADDGWYLIEDLPIGWGEYDIAVYVMPGYHMIAMVRDADSKYAKGCLTTINPGTVKLEYEDDKDKVTIIQADIGAKRYDIKYEKSHFINNILTYELVPPPDNKTPYTIRSIKLTDIHFWAGGDDIEREDFDIADSMKEIYMVVKHDSPEFELDIKTTRVRSDDDQTVFKLYDLYEGYATKDYRAVLENIPFYR